MRAEEIAELIMIALLLLARPISRALRKGKSPQLPQGQQGQGQGQQQPRRSQAPPPAPQPAPPAPKPAATRAPARQKRRAAPGFQTARWLDSVRQLERRALALSKNPKHQSLARIPGLANLSKSIQTAINARGERAYAELERLANELEAGSAVDTSHIQDITDRASTLLATADSAVATADALVKQRSQGALRARLAMMDALVDSLGSRGVSRKRWSLLWDGSPMTPSAAFPPDGDTGFAALTHGDAKSALGSCYLARGAVFDIIGSQPTMRDEVRRAAMVGPMAGRSAVAPFPAGANYDPVTSITAWAPNLLADAVSASLLGHAYPLGLIEVDARAGLRAVDAISIASQRGRYVTEPPLLIRMAAIDAVLHRAGGDYTFEAVKALKQRLNLPDEMRYVMPNGVSKRLRADALLALVGQVADALIDTRYGGIGDRRITEFFGQGVRPADAPKIKALRDQLVTGGPAQGPALQLWVAAIEAEAEHPDLRAVVLDRLTNAVTRAASQAAPGRRRRRAGRDATLFRDAYVLSEIL